MYQRLLKSNDLFSDLIHISCFKLLIDRNKLYFFFSSQVNKISVSILISINAHSHSSHDTNLFRYIVHIRIKVSKHSLKNIDRWEIIVERKSLVPKYIHIFTIAFESDRSTKRGTNARNLSFVSLFPHLPSFTSFHQKFPSRFLLCLGVPVCRGIPPKKRRGAFVGHSFERVLSLT